MEASVGVLSGSRAQDRKRLCRSVEAVRVLIIGRFRRHLASRSCGELSGDRPLSETKARMAEATLLAQGVTLAL